MNSCRPMWSNNAVNRSTLKSRLLPLICVDHKSRFGLRSAPLGVYPVTLGVMRSGFGRTAARRLSELAESRRVRDQRPIRLMKI